MISLFDWIKQNKEWIFSGIGVAVIVLLIEFIRSRKLKKNKKAEQIHRIAERYVDVLDHKTSGHSGIPGLIELGAAQLKKNKDVIELCIKIEEYGKPNPLSTWVSKYIDEKEILKFIKWQFDNKISYSPYYLNENNFIKLVEQYKNETS